MAEMCTDSGNLMAIAQQVIQQQQKHQQQQQLQHHQQQQMSPIITPFGLSSLWGGNHMFPFSDAGVFSDPFHTGPDPSSAVVVTEMMHEGGFGMSDFGSVVGRDEFDSDEWMESLIGGNSTVGECGEMIDGGQYKEFPVTALALVSDAFVSFSSSSPGVNGVFSSDIRESSSAVSCSLPTVEVQRWSTLPPLPPRPPQVMDSDGVRISSPPPPRLFPEAAVVLPRVGISSSLRSLLDCALLIDTDPDLAAKSLIRIRDSSSPHGNPTDRIAFYFSEALYQRLSSETLTVKSQSPSLDDFAFCYKTLNDVCPYTKFAHLTANQAILESTQTDTKIHIIDFGIVQGVQWSVLLQALATRPNGKPDKIRISGIPSPEHPEVTITTITATGNRLLSFAKLLDLDFEFVPILTPLHELTNSSFEIHRDESVAVNFMLQLHLLLGETSAAVEKLLRLARSFSPKVVTLGEFDLNTNGIGFDQRLTNAVGFYSAAFESLDQAMERDSVERERVERVLLGRHIKWAVDVGKQRVRMEENDNWTVLMKECGFEPFPHSHYALSQAKILLWNYNYSSRYGLIESSPGFLCLCWDDRPLLSVSSWK